MSDRFSFQPICTDCNLSLDTEDSNSFRLMMAVGESIDLTCPKCGAVWRFWLDIVTRQKKIGTKKNGKVAKRARV